jgi:hypothetical protein
MVAPPVADSAICHFGESLEFTFIFASERFLRVRISKVAFLVELIRVSR